MPTRAVGFDSPNDDSNIKRTNHLLVIGVDAYTHCPQLYNCVKDAQDFMDVLKKRFLFEERHITTIFNEKATRANIFRALRKLASTLGEKDNLLIYFSGHGEFDTIFNQGYWIPVNAKQGEHDQYIPNSDIRTALSAIKSHHTFLLSDSCFSGSLFAKGMSKQVSRRYESDPSRWGLTAGRNEIVSDGKQGDNSPFAQSLLYRLRQTEQSISVQELCAHVTEYVQANSNQSPIGEPLKVDGHKSGMFVFHLKQNATADWAEAQQSNTVAAYLAFSKKYPEHKNATIAAQRIAELEQKAKQAQITADWAAAEQRNTPQAYFSFTQKYPEHPNTPIAKQRIEQLEAAALWEDIQKTSDDSVFEIDKKIQLLRRYRKRYAAQEHAHAALDLGELMEYKRTFLNAKHSVFALERFISKPIPSVPNTEGIYQEAKQLWLDKTREEEERHSQETANAEKKRKEEARKAAAQAARKREQERKEAERQEAIKRAEKQRKAKVEQERQAALAAQKRQAEARKKDKRAAQQTASETTVQSDDFGAMRKYALIGVGVLLLLFVIWKFIGTDNAPLEEQYSDMSPIQEEVSSADHPDKDIPTSSGNGDFEMILVEGGTFQMGSNDYYDEKPVHSVTVDDFYIGKYEVTQKQWRDVMGSHPPELRFKGCDQCPVERVSWDDIQEFLKKLNAQNPEMNYRLPTEAEWEYAARGGNKSKGYKYAGSNSPSAVAWYDNNSSSETHKVGGLQPNELGLYDMSGNVYEWCQDVWHDDYAGAPDDGSAWMSGGEQKRRVLRGGSWNYDVSDCRSANRGWNGTDLRFSDNGFRLARH